MFSTGIFSDLGFDDVNGSYNSSNKRITGDLEIVYAITHVTTTSNLDLGWQILGETPLILRRDLDIAYEVIGGIQSDLSVDWQVFNARSLDLELKWYIQGDKEPTVVKNKVCISRPVTKTIKIC